jgi:hypothetical protein
MTNETGSVMVLRKERRTEIAIALCPACRVKLEANRGPQRWNAARPGARCMGWDCTTKRHAA